MSAFVFGLGSLQRASKAEEDNNEKWIINYEHSRSRVLGTSYDSTVNIYYIHVRDAYTTKDIMVPPLEVTNALGFLATMSPDGRFIAIAAMDQQYANWLYLWNVLENKSQCDPIRTFMDGSRCLAFQNNSRTIAAGSDSRSKMAERWDTNNGTVLPHGFYSNAGFWCMAFSFDGSMLAAGCFDNNIYLWDVPSGKPLLPPLSGHTGSILSLAFSQDGKTLASGSSDQTARLWDTKTGQQLQPPIVGCPNSVNCVAFNPDGSLLALGYGNSGTANPIYLWDIQNQKFATKIPGSSAANNFVTFSQDGNTVLSSAGKTVFLWDANSGNQKDHKDFPEPVSNICFPSGLKHLLDKKPIVTIDEPLTSSPRPRR